jgi:hypothetical protein
MADQRTRYQIDVSTARTSLVKCSYGRTSGGRHWPELVTERYLDGSAT